MINVLEDASRIGKQLMLIEPFYGIFLSTLNRVVRKDIPTAAVCKNNINYQLAINEEFWGSLDNDKKKIGLLKHELLHICFSHLENREEFPDHELHNLAADLEINQYLSPEYYPTEDIILLSLFPELNLPEKAGTKVYYDILQQAKKDGNSPSLNAMLDGNPSSGGTHGSLPNNNPSSGGTHGSIAENLHPTWDEFDNLSEADKKLIASQIKHQIKSIIESQKDRDRGFVPSELKEYIDSLFEISAPSYDWKSYFRRFFGSSSKIYTKKTRRKLNKRYEENPALKIKPKKHVLVGVDTSGSVGEKDLIEFFNEIYHMYKTGIAITIAEGDADIHNVYEYKGKMPEFVSGRGGTDMNPFIDYVNKHKQYNSLIILTDGFIGEKTLNTLKPTLTVLCSNGASVEEVKNNGWGNTIKIQN
jgi:predicted metal-dependent peptidase